MRPRSSYWQLRPSQKSGSLLQKHSLSLKPPSGPCRYPTTPNMSARSILLALTLCLAVMAANGEEHGLRESAAACCIDKTLKRLEAELGNPTVWRHLPRGSCPLHRVTAPATSPLPTAGSRKLAQFAAANAAAQVRSPPRSCWPGWKCWCSMPGPQRALTHACLCPRSCRPQPLAGAPPRPRPWPRRLPAVSSGGCLHHACTLEERCCYALDRPSALATRLCLPPGAQLQGTLPPLPRPLPRPSLLVTGA